MAEREGAGLLGHALAGLGIVAGVALAAIAGSIFAPDLAVLIAAGAIAAAIIFFAARFSLGMIGWSGVGAVGLALLAVGAMGTFQRPAQSYVLSEPELTLVESAPVADSAPSAPKTELATTSSPPRRTISSPSVVAAPAPEPAPAPPPPPAPEPAQGIDKAEEVAIAPAPAPPQPKKQPVRGLGGVVATPAPGAPTTATISPPAPAPAPQSAEIEEFKAQAPARRERSARTVEATVDEPSAAEAAPAAAESPALVDGRFSVNTPNPMAINRSAVVEVEIGLRDAPAPTDLGSSGPVISRDISITNEVEVDLVTTDFDVKKMTRMDALMVSPGEPARWAWEITPRSAGADKSIKIYVYGLTKKEGATASRRLIKTHEETIKVTITPAQTIQRSVAAVAGGLEPVAGVISAIGAIGGFLMGLLGWRRKRNAA